MKKNGVPVEQMERRATPMDNANLVLELLCLIDKTVFPTLQLFRALNQKGALVVQAEGRELAWRYVHADDIKSFGRSVCECIDSYDINSTVVTLTSGECVDKANKSTVLMLTPLHVSQAFHEQQIDSSIASAVGARKHQLPQNPLLYKLIKRQRDRTASKEMRESEA